MIERRLIESARAHRGLVAACTLALAACASGETPSGEAAPPEMATLGALAQAVRTASAAVAASDAGPLDPSVDAGGAGELAPSNDCCTASSSGGCADEGVAACVCQGDPFCCSTEYDALCVNQAVSRCGIDCDLRPPLSDCCSTSSVPGCSDADVAACVCEIDPFCCVFRFDQSCVNLARARCNPSCIEPSTSPASAGEAQVSP